MQSDFFNATPLVFASIALTLALAGCAGTTNPSRFFMLNSLPSEQPIQIAAAQDNGISLGIGPINFPKYLDRPQIVKRATANRLELSEFDRWAEPLASNFSRVLAENLAAMLKTDKIAFDPWNRSTPINFQVTVEVLRFDSTIDGRVILRTLWQLKRDNGRDLLLTKISSIQENLDTLQSQDNYDQVVAALSRTIERLGREIANAISALAPEGSVAPHK